MSEVNYIVAVDWKVLPDNYVSPNGIVLLDALTQDQLIILSVEDTLSLSEHEWHVPGQYLPSFIESSYFKSVCLPTPDGREPVLGTNDPLAWQFFMNRQMTIQWLGEVPHQPENPILIRAMHLANYVKDQKMMDWTCEYFVKIMNKGNRKQWKRVGNRLCRDVHEKNMGDENLQKQKS
ncbi:hypothetical protein AVEN_224790-1 [Araneus ventricosus]|uniref:Uncharacterized protein n=1 Tax=Araneus ventricosus TaxID=182803 RepID=A0A4Y2X689_ARAVE|nr:hypothetical protein AVEN_224790-1 [Araneus ventricosus]